MTHGTTGIFSVVALVCLAATLRVYYWYHSPRHMPLAGTVRTLAGCGSPTHASLTVSRDQTRLWCVSGSDKSTYLQFNILDPATFSAVYTRVLRGIPPPIDGVPRGFHAPKVLTWREQCFVLAHRFTREGTTQMMLLKLKMAPRVHISSALPLTLTDNWLSDSPEQWSYVMCKDRLYVITSILPQRVGWVDPVTGNVVKCHETTNKNLAAYKLRHPTCQFTSSTALIYFNWRGTTVLLGVVHCGDGIIWYMCRAHPPFDIVYVTNPVVLADKSECIAADLIRMQNTVTLTVNKTAYTWTVACLASFFASAGVECQAHSVHV